jgi:hypothetical protein
MPTLVEGAHRLLHTWQLALLRFAVTRDESDRLNVAALAAELDHLGGRRHAGDSLHFFRRASSQLCAAIGGQHQNAAAILDGKQIEDPRLRLAFTAAVGMTHSEPAPSQLRPKRNPDLFRGLPARRSASL